MKPFAAIIAALTIASLAAGQRFVGEAKPKEPLIFKAYDPKPKYVPPVPPRPKEGPTVEQVIPKPEPVRERPLERLSLADAIRLAAHHANPQTRFLWLGDALNAEELRNWTVLLLGHLNHLSTESDFGRMGVVPGSNGQLLQIDPSDYGPAFAASWEKLSNSEPYFHVRLEVTTVDIETPWQGGVWPGDGRFYARGSFNVWTQKKVKKSALAPWLAKNDAYKAAISQLVSATGSQTPIVSGQWFLFQTNAQQDRNPGYYDFLGLKKLADVEALAGFDKKVMDRAKRKELLEAVASSGVARQARRIGSFPTFDSLRYYITFDSSLAIDKHNPLRILDSENFDYDASEIFGGLPNGLWFFGLFAKNGDRQASAPDFVGPDFTSTSNDGRIHIGISCQRCHYPNSGLQPVDAWARNLFKPPLQFKSVKPEIERDLRAKYFRDLEAPMQDDRVKFERSLKECCGVTPKVYADLWAGFWQQYEAPVLAERAAREIGIDEPMFKAAILAYLKANPIADPVITSFLRGVLVPRDSWLEIYPNVAEIMERYGKK